jgi:hypothetical protein
MARKSINELIAQANADFPDNVTGLITPAKLRQFCLDFLAAISPAYGYLAAVGPLSQTFNTAPSVVSFDTAYDSDPSQTTSNATADTVSRAERGTSTINFSVDVALANNIGLTFTIYKQGVATPWSISAVGRGIANPVSIALTAIDYADPAGVYTVRCVAENDGVAVTLTNALFVLAVDPVRSFT